MSRFKESLTKYMDAGFPILYIDTTEEDKAESIVCELNNHRGIIRWDIRGFQDLQDKSTMTGQNLEATLEMLLSDKKNLNHKAIILKDVHFFLEEPEIVSRLKTLAQLINSGEIEDCTVVIIVPVLKVPVDLESFITILSLDYLTSTEIRSMITDFVNDNDLPKLNDTFLDELALTFKGLTEAEINNILALAVADDGEINHADLALIFDQKQQRIKKSGILDMIPVKESIDDIGGLDNLKNWLKRKAEIFKNIKKASDFGVDIPKGVLIAGMPGCGKSLNAKAAAKLFGVPLLRLDMGKLMGKYVGESEGNMRKAIALAEACSPCVLWIDELEKAFAGIGSSGGNGEVATRLFGNFLTWLQEKNSLAFVVATANDIAKMPPELMRKGRFDEIFYVGLPNEKERRKIFEIHISKRRKTDLSHIDLEQLVSKTKGYSGADIEGVVRDSIESAFVNHKNGITTEDILSAISSTNSLSEIMKDSLDKISKMYEERKFKNASA